ncbi:AEC family transporter [bacterium]|nr:AEC family transporter [bacterium]
MTTIYPILQFIIKTFGLMVLGYISFRLFLPKGWLKPLSTLFVNFLIPVMILHKFLLRFNMEVLLQFWYIPFITLAFLAIGIAGGYLFGKITRTGFMKENLALFTFLNSGYLSVPILLEIMKGDTLDLAIVLLFMYIMLLLLLLWSLGVLWITGGETKPKANTLPVPFIITAISMILGVAGVGKYVPGQVMDILDLIGKIGIYGVMFVLGGILSKIVLKKVRIRGVLLFVFAKNFVLPLIFIFLIWAFNPSKLLGWVLSLACIMPPANNFAVMLEKYRHRAGNEEFVYPRLLYSYIGALISIPVWVFILELLYPELL